MPTQIKIFVDTCVFQAAFPYRREEVYYTICWGDRSFHLKQEEYKPRHFDKELFQKESPHIRHLANASRDGIVNLYTSDLVWFELFGGPGTSRPQTLGNDFNGCSIQEVETPFKYSVTFGSNYPKLKEQIDRAFRSYSDARLEGLVRELGSNRLIDSVHLITADSYGMDFMVTLDKKLIDSYRKSTHPLSVVPVFPSEVLREIHETHT